MKLRGQYDRTAYCESGRFYKPRDSPDQMQSEKNSAEGNGISLTLEPELFPRMAGVESSDGPENAEGVVCGASGPRGGQGATSRRPRAASHTHSHSHSHSHGPECDGQDPDMDSGESSTTLSELSHIMCWLRKSLPFLVILCAKLVLQHAWGLAVAVGLFTTFMYVNRTVQSQVFLHERRMKLQCAWLLLLLASSSLLLFYTFNTLSLYRCLVLASPDIDLVNFWEVLWCVGVTNFIGKFLAMGLKCLVLLLPGPLMAFRKRGQWYMLIEEVGQLYQVITPVPLWFWYLVSYDVLDGSLGLTLGVLLALLYFIMKLLALFGRWGSLHKTFRAFHSSEVSGAPAAAALCREAGEVCPICQAAFRQPRVLVCQHVFCEECIDQWLIQEKKCPLCRSVITDKLLQWRDGATSAHLQLY